MDYYSVVIYISTFFFSVLLFSISNRLFFEKRKKERILWGYVILSVGILIPCLLAAFRDVSVGQDVAGYVLPNFDYSTGLTEKGFFYFYENMPFPTEIGFAFILYIGIINRSVGLSFFIMQLMTILPVYMTLAKFKNVMSVPLGMATYFFLNYNFSLSGMRGSIAMSILLLMSYYMYKGKHFIAILLSGIAFLFHDSAIILAFLFYLIYYNVKRGFNRRFMFIILVIGMSILAFWNEILQILFFMLSNLNARYLYYLQKDADFEGVFMTDFLSKLSLIAVVYFLLKKRTKLLLNKYLFVICVIGRVLLLLNTRISEFSRIANYFDMYLILYSAVVYSTVKKQLENKFASYTIVLMPSFLYWLYFIMKVGAYDTNIYRFR